MVNIVILSPKRYKKGGVDTTNKKRICIPMYVYQWLIHVGVWQKQTQYCNAIILQLKANLKKRDRIADAPRVRGKKQAYRLSL